jgi:hypothetical protein
LAKAILTQSYQHLLKILQNEIVSGLRAIEYQKALTYWNVGKHISKDILKNKLRADYGQKLYKKLSKDLTIDRRTLQRTVQFYHKFPKASARPQLSWTKVKSLLSVEDESNRSKLMDQAVRNKLSTRALNQAIKKGKKDLNAPIPTLVVKLGKVFTYRLKLIDDHLEVDCGFKVTRNISLKGLKSLQEGDIVESKTIGKEFSLIPSNRTKQDLYTYQAKIIRVVDGDTLVCSIDLGFSTQAEQILRLRGINAPEMKTKAGEASKHFVQRRLKKGSDVIIRTYSTDIFGRYVADTYHDNGKFLNQELLNSGHAEAY